MRKNIFGFTTLAIVLFIIPGGVLALGDNFFSVSNPITVKAVDVKEDANDNTRILQERRDEATRAAEKQREAAKKTLLPAQAERMQKATQTRLNVYLKTAALIDQLLQKIQIRIDEARSAGKDVSSAEAALKDAQVKYAQIKTTLDQIQSEKDIAINKETFTQIHQEFLSVNHDLTSIRTDLVRAVNYIKVYGDDSKDMK